jgi:exodeoxyribonuclease V alpha subunit
MQTRNNYGLQWMDGEDMNEGTGVFNGDIGRVADVRVDASSDATPGADENLNADEGTVTVVYDETRYVNYRFTELGELEHAFAITIHKSQGSEFPAVIIPIYAAAPMLSTRNILYTAVTRARKLAVLVGSERRLRAMIDNDSGRGRQSGLRSFLAESSRIASDLNSIEAL